MTRTILVTLLTVVAPVGLLAGVMAMSLDRERQLHADALAASRRQLASERAASFDGRLRRALGPRLDALAAGRTVDDWRAAHELSGPGQGLVVDRQGAVVYPPPPPGRAETAWPVVEERALAGGMALARNGDHVAALAAYAAHDSPAAAFRRGLSLAVLGRPAEAAAALDAAAAGAGPAYFQLAAGVEAALAHRIAGHGERAASRALDVLERLQRAPGALPRASAAAYLRERVVELLDTLELTPPQRARRAGVARLAARQQSEARLRTALPLLESPIRSLGRGGDSDACVRIADGAWVLLFARRGRIVGTSLSTAWLEARFGSDSEDGLTLVAPEAAPVGAATAPVALLAGQRVVAAVPAARSADAAAALRQRVLSQLLLIGLAVALAGVGAALLARAYRRAQVASEARAAFIARMSHELRTPLALIHGVAETLALERVVDPAGRRRHLDTLLRESEALGRLVQGVLDHAAGDALPTAPVEVDLVGLVRDVCASVETAHGLTLTLRLPEAPLPRVVDGDGVRLALLNLLTNAVKYAPGRPLDVELTARRGTAARIVVADRGPGVTPAEAAGIFEPFVRGSAAGPGVRGAGLGLALVADVARRHGGRVDVAPRPGGGSVFSLTLGEVRS